METARRPGGLAEVVGRAAVTAGATLLSFALGRIALPFTGAVRQAMGPAGDGSLSLGALGLRPLVAAFLLVEVLALAVPALRARRHAGWRARRPLALAAWILAVGLAALQAYGITAFLRSAGAAGLPVALGPAELAAIGSSVVAGSVLAAGLAELISRRGLGNGFAVLAAAGTVAALAGGLPAAADRLGLGQAALMLLLVAGVAAAAARFVGHRPAAPVSVPVPTCGGLPLDLAAALQLLPFSLVGWVPQLRPLVDRIDPGAAPYHAAGLALVLLLGLLLSALFARRPQVAGAWRRADPGVDAEVVGQALRLARRRSLLSLAILGLLPIAGAALGLPFGLGFGTLASAVVLGVAVHDVREDVRSRLAAPGLVPAYPLHRVHALEPALHALAAAGIPAVARNRAFRALLQFFGPYAPIELCVPPGRAEEAAALCARVVDAPRGAAG